MLSFSVRGGKHNLITSEKAVFSSSAVDKAALGQATREATPDVTVGSGENSGPAI